MTKPLMCYYGYYHNGNFIIRGGGLYMNEQAEIMRLAFKLDADCEVVYHERKFRL